MPNFNGLWTSRQQMQARGGNVWPSVPGAPTSPVATAGNASASVAFVAPADTGYPAGAIIGYRVTSSPGGFTGTGATSPVTVTGLTNGTAYTFTVAAQNVNGYGPESVASNSVTPVLPNYIEDVFSTYLYTGNGATQTITNGINLSGQGGLTWIRRRGSATDHHLEDTVRGATKYLISNTTNAEQTNANAITAFNSTGFSLGSYADVNSNAGSFVSWTFRKQPKFFDVVTYTGNGTQGRSVSHNLGSAPGFMIVKRTDGVDNWRTYHRSLGGTKFMSLDTTAAAGTANTLWNDADPTSTVFYLGNDSSVNGNGMSYVAYLFAHDAGGFGTSGSDNVISCGSFTASSGAATVTLGYEPQWIMFKRTDSSTGGNWYMVDTMRGWSFSAVAELSANTSNAEDPNAFVANPTATGFSFGTGTLTASGTYIYITIRRGPMAVPTSATTVFSPFVRTGTGATAVITTPNFVVDSTWIQQRTSGWQASKFFDRLRGATNLVYSNTTSAEVSDATTLTSFASNVGFTLGDDSNNYSVNRSGEPYINYALGRAPGFFDEVCYTGNQTSTPKTHNLGVAPELMIVKSRSAANDWAVYSSALGATQYLRLNNTSAAGTTVVYWNNTAPTSTGFTCSIYADYTNTTGQNYVAYLFATCAGVSKVGSYTGTGATQTIACGFAAGARFVLIKRTDTTGDWYYWDSVRGMVVGTDPSLLFNTNAAEVNANSVYTTTTGFQIVSTAAGINASGGTYIFLAIA